MNMIKIYKFLVLSLVYYYRNQGNPDSSVNQMNIFHGERREEKIYTQQKTWNYRNSTYKETKVNDSTKTGSMDQVHKLGKRPVHFENKTPDELLML